MTNASLAPFRNAGLQIFTSPGVTNWRHVYPDFNGDVFEYPQFDAQRADIRRAGNVEHGVEGLGRGARRNGLAGIRFWSGVRLATGRIVRLRISGIAYDWAFYRNADHTFEDILNKLADTNSMLDGVKMNGTYVSYFWADPFSAVGRTTRTRRHQYSRYAR